MQSTLPKSCSLALIALVVPLAVAGTQAAPLAKDACDTLKAEQSALAGTGLRADVAKGAAWAKANLSADRMKAIQRLIEVDEQIIFRCEIKRPPADTDADAGGDSGKPEAAKPATAKAKPAVTDTPGKGEATADAAPVQPAAAGEKAHGAAGAGGAEAKPEPKKKSAAKPKSKPEPKPDATSDAKPAGAAETKPDAKVERKSTGKSKESARAKVAPDDAYVPPEGAPQSTLVAPPVSPSEPSRSP